MKLKSLQEYPSAHPPFGILGLDYTEGRDGAQSIFIPEALSSGSAWMSGSLKQRLSLHVGCFRDGHAAKNHDLGCSF